MNQIRFGKLLGFDFNKHRNDKVGVLRGFVKTQMSNMEEKLNMNNLIKNKRKRAKQEKKEEVSNIEEINITIDETNQNFTLPMGEIYGMKANSDLSNLTTVGEKHFLNKSQITNCLLEVPQRIKHTLENDTLTIKAGSVVIVPLG